jgi:pseudouridine-5'-phosphate glycosidase
MQGLPSPLNHQTAVSLEKIVRSRGCIPATIGVLSGMIHVGLSPAELQQLSDIEANAPMVKISRRDLGAAIALKRSGGTTIAGTMVIAHAAGIRVFGTGGLGGVHRGGQDSVFALQRAGSLLTRTSFGCIGRSDRVGSHAYRCGQFGCQSYSRHWAYSRVLGETHSSERSHV